MSEGRDADELLYLTEAIDEQQGPVLSMFFTIYTLPIRESNPRQHHEIL
jgi:hypothetical protein